MKDDITKDRFTAGYMIVVLAILSIYFLMVKDYPLISTFGIEAGNLLVLILGPIYSLIPLLTSKNQHDGFITKFRKQFLWLFLSIGYLSLLLWLNGRFKLSCGSGTGFFPFLLTLLPLLLNTVFGIFLSCVFVRTFSRIFSWLAFYIGYYLFLALAWYKEGSFRILSHFSIINTSDLLQGLSFSVGFISFRIATGLFALSILCFGIVIFPNTTFNFNRRRGTKRLALPLFFILLFVGFVSEKYARHELGKNRSDLISDYYLVLSSGSISIKADPQKVPLKAATDMLEEALLWQQRLEKRIGEISNKPITIWLHVSDEDKFIYTGAKNVHFALPKHREIHIAGLEVPHPVLGHELAHVYISEHTNSILGAPGGKFIPNMALSEGLAMVLTEELNIDYDLSTNEQAMALSQIGFAPDVTSLFKSDFSDFFKIPMRSAYIVSSSFLGFFLNQQDIEKRPQVLRDLIRKGNLSKFVGEENFKKLVMDFNAFQKGSIPQYALSWAKRNFEEHGILTKSCLKNSSNEAIDKLDEAIINHNAKELVLALSDMKPHQKATLLFENIEKSLEKSDGKLALEYIDLAGNDLLSSEMLFKKVQALILIDDYETALKILNEIDSTSLAPWILRSSLIMESFLYEILNNAHYAELAKAGLKILARSFGKNEMIEKNTFFFELGRASTKKAIYNSTLLMAKYLEARLYMRLSEYKKTLSITEEILAGYEIPHPILLELLLMRARMLKEMRQFDEAILAFIDALKMNTSQGTAILIDDEMSRIKYYSSRL